MKQQVLISFLSLEQITQKVHKQTALLSKYTLKGHGNGDIEDGDDLALALVHIDVTVDGSNSQGPDSVALGLCSDVDELSLKVGFGPVDAVLVNPVPTREVKGREAE